MSRSSSQKKSREHDQQHAVREPSVMLGDLIEELIWPRVLRAPALALSPNRLVSGCVGFFLITIVVRLFQLFRGDTAQNNESIPILDSLGDLGYRALDSLWSLDPSSLFSVIIETATMLRDTVMHNPVISSGLGIPIVLILSLTGGAISRSAAFEFAQGRIATREETLHFTLQRTWQFLLAVIAPIAFSVIIFLLIALGGLLLSVPVVDIFGALLYGIGLVLGIIATLVLLLHVIASPIIIPALATEGTDAFDAIQRCYAYVVGRPLRYLIYVFILTLMGAFAAAIFAMIAQVSIEMTDWAATFFANDATDRVLTGQGELGATKSLANNIVEFWHGIVEILIAGYLISLFFTSSTLLYLAVRRICDGQGISEIWEPTDHA